MVAVRLLHPFGSSKLKCMSRLIFAALLTSLATAPLAAQEVPGRDLLEFPLGALAEPRPLASSVLGALWNPARSAGPMQPRLELGFGALTTPIEQGVDGRAIAAAGRLPMGFSASLMYAALDVSDIRRTATDPQTLGDRTKPGKENWLITMGVCTHLGCVPLGAGEGEVKGEFGGYFCPCHGSLYDTAGRVRRGPAPENLYLPPYRFLSDTAIRIG